MKTNHSEFRRPTFILIMVAISLALILALQGPKSHTVQAGHIGCGSVLTSSGSPHVLDSDVGPCDDDSGPALTVQSNATLDLNGFRVYCQDTDRDSNKPDGILVEGTGATVTNEGMNALNAVNGCRHGIVVTGDSNTFSNVASRDNAYDGFRIEGTNNNFTGNTATGNGKALASCPEEAEGGSGFSLHGDSNILNSNVSDGNACDGILIDSDSNRFRLNYVNGNDRYGFYIEGGAGQNSVTFNNAWGNGEYDMSDENPNCGTNTWRFNFFEYADQPCIR